MHEKNLLFALALAVLFANTALAFTQTVLVTVQTDGEARVSHFVSLENESAVLLEPISDFSGEPAVMANNAPIAFEIQNKNIRIPNTQSLQSIEVTYVSNSLTSKNNEEWRIELNGLPHSISQLKIILPPGIQITGFSPNATIFFQEPSLVIEWLQNALVQGSALVRYSRLFTWSAQSWHWA